jgi:hypothetical protein
MQTFLILNYQNKNVHIRLTTVGFYLVKGLIKKIAKLVDMKVAPGTFKNKRRK